MHRALVPRLGTRVVLLRRRRGRLAQRAAAMLRFSATATSRCSRAASPAWKAAGLELFTGVNVPTKAFGELVEHDDDTPRIGRRN